MQTTTETWENHNLHGKIYSSSSSFFPNMLPRTLFGSFSAIWSCISFMAFGSERSSATVNRATQRVSRQ
jgi:hypothetical protein